MIAIVTILTMVLLCCPTFAQSTPAAVSNVLNAKISNGQMFTADHVKDSVVEPDYLPENFHISSSEQMNFTYKTVYSDDTGGYIIINQTPAFEQHIQFDANSESRTIKIYDYDGVITIGDRENALVFSDKQNIFYINSTLAEDDLIRIAQSLCKKTSS